MLVVCNSSGGTPDVSGRISQYHSASRGMWFPLMLCNLIQVCSNESKTRFSGSHSQPIEA